MTATEQQGPGANTQSRLDLLKFQERFRDSLLKGENLKPIEEVGKGGFAVVYKCRLKREEGAETVAVKKLKPCLCYDEEIDNFLAEAQLMRRLVHPNIVQFKGIVDHFGEKESSLAVVEEFMNLGSLKDFIVRQMESESSTVYSARQGLQWMLQVAKGLEYLHGLKATVIHRDLKPENILLTYEKGIRVKIADFGLSALVKKPAPITVESGLLEHDLDRVLLAKKSMRKIQKLPSSKNETFEKLLARQPVARKTSNLMHSLSIIERVFDVSVRSSVDYIKSNVEPSDDGFSPPTMNLLRSSEFVEESKFRNLSGKTGSLMYMAPEVHRYKKYNEKVDVYSFGVILFEVMSGYKITYMIVRSDRPPKPQIEKYASKVVGGYRPPIPCEWPNSLATLIKDCWAADPEDRPSMNEVVISLQNILMEKMYQSRKHEFSRHCCFVQ